MYFLFSPFSSPSVIFTCLSLPLHHHLRRRRCRQVKSRDVRLSKIGWSALLLLLLLLFPHAVLGNGRDSETVTSCRSPPSSLLLLLLLLLPDPEARGLFPPPARGGHVLNHVARPPQTRLRQRGRVRGAWPPCYRDVY